MESNIKSEKKGIEIFLNMIAKSENKSYFK